MANKIATAIENIISVMEMYCVCVCSIRAGERFEIQNTFSKPAATFRRREMEISSSTLREKRNKNFIVVFGNLNNL